METININDFSQGALDYFYSIYTKMVTASKKEKKIIWVGAINVFRGLDDYNLEEIREESKKLKKYTPKKYLSYKREIIMNCFEVLETLNISEKDRVSLTCFLNLLLFTKEKEVIEENEKLKKKLQKLEKQLDKKEKKGSYNVSGHLIDQRLKYNYPKEGALDLFSHLQESTIQKIEERGERSSEVVWGIKLDPAETKVVDTLCKMLHKKSQNLEPKEDNYYTGNKKAVVVKNKEENILAPKLGFTLYEFTKEYLDTDRKIGGKDIENAIEVLTRLSSKSFLVKYKEESSIRGGGTRIKEIELFEKIINLPTLRQTDYSKEGIEISKKEEKLVILHPIFRSQIDSKFIKYPADINSRTALAYGSQNVSLITINLRDYLMRYLSTKTYTPQIMAEKLYYQVAEKFMKESRKTRVKKDLEKAIQSLLKLELLKSYEIQPSKTTGEPMYIFTINKDFS
jgi:hypothetical protein